MRTLCPPGLRPLQVPPKFAGFFTPCDYLVSAAQAGRKLEAGVPATSKM